ncbi:FAD-dependent oxidoreductase [Xanthobacter autotrophicus DSM 431]|uniref:GcvT family protein n=1 Tax=Xanthobacter nonsaccharivorans TaxID=3119912 RepID=UPI003728389B
MSGSFDRTSRIVIIGGGAIGCSLAYHLARRGEKDVLLLEKSLLTNGCTWHAAGLVGQLRGRRNLTRLMQNSVAVFDRLAAESEQAIDWKKVGSLRLASSPDRWSEIRRSMTLAKSFGFECHSLSTSEAKDLFPFIDPEGVVGAAFIPSDGYIDPYALTQAFAFEARKGGVTIQENTLVTRILKERRRVVGVETDKGTIGCEILVNCAGLWAKRIGEMAGVSLAAGVVEHQYFLTEKKLDLPKTLPTLRDPDKNFYLKPDVAAFAIGGWEDGTKGCWRSRPPFEFGRELFPENMDRLELFALPCAERLPILNEVGIQTVINGPIPASADGEPIMGLAPELDNFFVACGFTAGIAASGGAGEAMANWIIDGDPGMDLWAFDVRRFGKPHAVGRFLEERAIEAYGNYYKVHWPAEENKAGRGLRRSPLHEQLKAAGALFGARFGWERPLWFPGPEDIQPEVSSFEGKPSWFDGVGKEHRAIREGVVLIDQTSFSKFLIEGAGATELLEGMSSARIAGEPGRCIYTNLLNSKGGIEAEVTLLHIGEDRFVMNSGSAFGVRDANWVTRQIPAGSPVRLTEVTSAYAVINICGPLSRAVLQQVSDDDFSNESFPFLAVREVEVGDVPVRAVRVGFVGELGFELHVPTEYAAGLYETLKRAGAAFGIRDVGYRAIETCRLEKGYLYWSAEIGPDQDPLSAGLGFAVDFSKDFKGRDALLKLREGGPSHTLELFTLEGFVPLLGGETILKDGKVVGQTASCGFGHTVGKMIAFGWLPVEAAKADSFEIEAFGTAYSASRVPRTLYDPDNSRLLA